MFLCAVKDLIARYKPSICVVMETRISGAKADSVIKKMGFSDSYREEAHGFSVWNFVFMEFGAGKG